MHPVDIMETPQGYWPAVCAVIACTFLYSFEDA